MTTLRASDTFCRVTTNGPASVVLYSPVKAPGIRVFVVNDTTQLGTTTITTAAGNINGSASLLLVGPGAWAILVADGTNYKAMVPGAGGVSSSLTFTGTAPVQVDGDNAPHALTSNKVVRLAPGTGVGKTWVWNGSAWAEGNDFGAQNVVTSGTLGAGATTLASLTVTGDLTVNGTTTHINSTVVDVKDRVVHVNHATGIVAVPSLMAGLEVDRGSADGVTPRDGAAIVWDEPNSTWRFSLNTAGDDSTFGTDLAVRASKFSLGASTAPSLESSGNDLVLKVGTANASFFLKDGSNVIGSFNWNASSAYFQVGANAAGFQFLANSGTSQYLRFLVGGATPVGVQFAADSIQFMQGSTAVKGNWNNTGLRIADGNAAIEKLDVGGRVRLDQSTAPAAPATGVVLWVDSNNDLYVTGADGSLTLLANG